MPVRSGVAVVGSFFGPVVVVPAPLLWPRMLQDKPSTASSANALRRLRIAILLCRFPIRLRMLVSLPGIIFAALHGELLATGQSDLRQAHRVGAILGEIACHGDLVARLDYAFA